MNIFLEVSRKEVKLILICKEIEIFFMDED
jgi:hypothetical protein